MKLEVGMYVRTKNGIKQIYEIDNNKTKWKYLYKLKQQDGDGTIDLSVLCDNDIIGKPSFNPIDLIEAGDVIAGIDGHKFEVYAIGSDCVYINELKEFVLINEIEEILTYEQFENNCFLIGDEKND